MIEHVSRVGFSVAVCGLTGVATICTPGDYVDEGRDLPSGSGSSYIAAHFYPAAALRQRAALFYTPSARSRPSPVGDGFRMSIPEQSGKPPGKNSPIRRMQQMWSVRRYDDASGARQPCSSPYEVEGCSGSIGVRCSRPVLVEDDAPQRERMVSHGNVTRTGRPIYKYI